MKTKFCILLSICFQLKIICNIDESKKYKDLIKSAPVAFEENKGQIISDRGHIMNQIYYRFSSASGSIYLAKWGVSYVFYDYKHIHRPQVRKEGQEREIVNVARIDMELVGARIDSSNIISEYPLEVYINYYNKYFPQGLKNIKQYRKITFKNIYPNIDWVWHIGLKGKDPYAVKYDFIVHPGGNPAMIRMRYKYADVIYLNGKKLKISTPNYDFEEGELNAFTETGSPVEMEYNIINGKEVIFKIKNRWKAEEDLIIDPPLGLVWGTYFGGDAWEKLTDVWCQIDGFGNVFVVSNTNSSQVFPTINPGSGAYFQVTFQGPSLQVQGKGGDACIFKFNNNGALVWCTYFGGSGDDNACSVAINAANEVFVVGSTASSNFPLMNWAGAYNLGTYQGGANQNNEGGDAFILKFSNNGNLLWSTFFGGSADEVARAVEIDNFGNIFVSGWTESTNFPLLNPGGGAYYQANNGGLKDVFISKFNSNGQLIWSTYYGGSGNDIANSIYISGSNVYFTGETSSSNFPLLNSGGGAYFQSTIGGNTDAFILRTNTSGVLIWATFIGGSNEDKSYDVCVNSSGEIYLIGHTNSTNLPVLNPGGGSYFQSANAGQYDVFVYRFGNAGNMIWGTYLGGTLTEYGRSIISDNCGNVYISGNTYSNDLPVVNPGGGAFYVANNSSPYLDDVFIGAFNFTNALVWLTYNGTTGFDEQGTCFTINSNTNHLYIVGYWCFYSLSNGYQALPGAYNKTNIDADDFFIMKLELASCNISTSINVILCYGTTTVLSFPNFTTLTNPTYSIQPGGQSQTNPNFTINPISNTTYTLYMSGLNNNNVMVTVSVVAHVTVNPTPTGIAQVFHGTCANVTNSVNIPVSFLPSGNLNYTVQWSPQPQSASSVNTATAYGLTSGPNSATITASNGCSIVVPFTVNPVPQPASFVVVPSTNIITCSNSNVSMTASVTNGVPLSFTWTGCSPGNLTGSVVTFTSPCTGQVVGTSSTGCSHSQSFQITQDITPPSINVNPTLVTVNCNSNTATSFTGTSSSSVNVTTQWYYINAGTLVPVGQPQGSINIFNPSLPGQYVFTATNILNGCSSSLAVQANSSIGVPQFTVTSTTNFTIGCASTSVTALQITSVITSPIPNAGVIYAMIQPGSTASPVWTNNPTWQNLTVPGTYTLLVTDVTNSCTASQPVSIIQNTLPPSVNIQTFTNTLTCFQPSVVLIGVSSNTNAQITWTVPIANGNSVIPQSHYTVYINTTVSNSSNNITAIGTYTVGALDPNNLCQNTKTIQILQDIRLPILTPTTSPNKITCKDPDVVLFNHQQQHPMNASLVTSYCWIPPQITNSVCQTQLNTSVAGIHTCIAVSNINGCSVIKTYTVLEDILPPKIINDDMYFTIECADNPTTQICVSLSENKSGITYTWIGIPVGATVSGLTSSCIVTNYAGNYAVLVTNTVNGCSSHAHYSVKNGTINAAFTPEPFHGFAPLNVNFINHSATSLGNTSVISSWYYGNGQTQYNVITNLTSTTYTAPGIYTVVLHVKKGNCIDTAIQIIKVEMPSSIQIPNIFSPNGDGINDIFRLIASSLKYVHIIIFDRWGNLVYETESYTGNFAWDGKNFKGKDCASGVYFYILNATGLDDKKFEYKGNVTLVR